jgi:Xaa-Pro aminopeptidase
MHIIRNFSTTPCDHTMQISEIQSYLKANQMDGWLLYDFRGSNPVALHVAGLATSGSRRWFLWIPAAGEPQWLIHAIEGSTFRTVAPDMEGEKLVYAGWRDLAARLPKLVGAGAGRPLRIAMEYSPGNAIPYVSRVDAGTKELVEECTGAEIVSSADLVQLAQAVLTDAQMESHRRAAAICLAAKDAAFARIRACLRSATPTSEFEIQQLISDYFVANGCEFDHPAIVSVNAHGADPHYAPTPASSRPILPGDMVLIDLWARLAGDPLACYADITWTGYCGAEIPPRAAEIFAHVAAGRDAAVALAAQRIAAGEPVYGYEVDDACRDLIDAAGYGDAFFHRTGHSLGTLGHFNGVNIDNYETQDRRLLIPGIMFTVEPGIYLPEFDFDASGAAKGLGIRSEINCYVHPDHLEVTTLPLQTEILSLL